MSGRVAVIGAGVAGATVARTLARAGHEVTLFEKARGAGGRTSTRRTERDAFDHGAQYFTVRTPDFGLQVERWRNRGVVDVWHSRIGRLERGFVSSTDRSTTRYVGIPGMNALAKDLARDLPIHVGERIERIEGTAGDRQLIADGGAVHSGFAAVVVATPAPQAVPLLAGAPRLAALAAGVEMLPCYAAMVTFDESIALELDGAFVSDSPLAWAARNLSKPLRPSSETWVLQASAEWSEAHLEEAPEPVGERLVREFARAIDRPLPRIRHLAAHRWRFARTAIPRRLDECWDAAAQIGICGDWTLGDRVEDAYSSGIALARAMADRPWHARDLVRSRSA